MKSDDQPDYTYEVIVHTDQWGRETVRITGIGECRDGYRQFVLIKAARKLREAAREFETFRQCLTCAYRPDKPGGLCRQSGKHPRNFTYQRVCEHWQFRESVVVFDPKRRKTTPKGGPGRAA